MALVQCKECGNQISKSATACPQCGAKVKRTSLFTKIVAGIFVIGFLSAVFGPKNSRVSDVPAAPSATEVARVAALTPEQKAAEEKQRQDVALAQIEKTQQQLGLRWNYDESKDEMGRGTVRNATVSSLNQVTFGFPYAGAQRGTLQLRNHPKYGKDIILSIDKGQFLCNFNGCRVSVKFDDGKPQTYSANEAADHSTTHLFLSNYARFLAGAKRSKKVYIEAQFYQEASRVFEFDVSGLKW